MNSHTQLSPGLKKTLLQGYEDAQYGTSCYQPSDPESAQVWAIGHFFGVNIEPEEIAQPWLNPDD